MALTDKQRLLRKVQSAGFALVEANLYLDSHPTCPSGLEYFAKYKTAYEEAVKEYEDRFGPLTITGADCSKRWEWVSEPFPWERSAN